MTVARFPEPEDVGFRQWGKEILLAHSPKNWTLKEIIMKPGAEGGLQFHRLKDEGGVINYGELLVTYDDGSGQLVNKYLGPGDVFHFPAGSVHKATALCECSYYEVSTPHFNDRVHVEKAYGIEKEAGGLPSTELHEVETR